MKPIPAANATAKVSKAMKKEATITSIVVAIFAAMLKFQARF